MTVKGQLWGLVPGKLYLALRDLSAIDYAVTGLYKGKIIKVGSVCMLLAAKNIVDKPQHPAIIELKLLSGKTELTVLINKFAVEDAIERFYD